MPSDQEEDYVPWIQQYCDAFAHDYFVAVPHEFIEDDFNLTGLSLQVHFYREALYTILDYQVNTADDPIDDAGNNGASLNAAKGGNSKVSKSELPNKALLSNSADMLYGLIHARYITTKAGLTAMATKFERNEFGSCPRYYCDGMHLIPVGSTDIPGQETVRLYCPCCSDIYLPSSSRYLNIDGAFFGTTFPGLLVKMFPEIDNQCRIRINKFNQNEFGLKLFGFKINELSACGPRMKWLRLHPKTEEQRAEFQNCQFALPLDSGDEDLDNDDGLDDDDGIIDDDDKTMASENN